MPGDLRISTKDDAAVRRAIEFIKREQEPDGSWFGRWGVNYIYGTVLVLRGLEAVGVDHHEPAFSRRGMAAHDAESRRRLGRDVRFLRRSESQGSGPSTASQTAWAVHGTAGGQRYCAAIPWQRGIAYLLKTQRRDGSWDETAVHRHRIPARVLPDVLHVPAVFPAAGADDVREGDGETKLVLSTEYLVPSASKMTSTVRSLAGI